MTDVQSELLSLFRSRGLLQLEQLYLAGSKIIEDSNFPARVTMLGHALREIYWKSPEALGFEKPDRIEWRGALDRITNPWIRCVRHNITRAQTRKEMASLPLSIPMTIGIEIDDLVEANRTLSLRREEWWRRFFSGDISGQPIDEVIEEWKSAGAGGEKLAHAPTGEVDEDERYKKCLEHWKVMESRLHARLSSQQEVFAEIDDDLERANRPAS